MSKSLSVFIKHYLPAIVWMVFIFYLSGIPDLRYSPEVGTEIFLRKGAHFLEFIILYFLIFRIFFWGHKLSFKKSLNLAFLVALLFAASDEIHQAFVPGRSGKIIDVIYDSISIFVGTQFFSLIQKRKVDKKIIFYLLIAFGLLVFLEYQMIKEGEKVVNEKIKKEEELKNIIEQEKIIGEENRVMEEDKKREEEKVVDKEKENPQKFFIKVPFTTQAPFAVWDTYHEEACEEASLIMVKYFLDGKKLNKEISEKEIQALIKFQIKNYGDYKDTTAEESVKLFNDFFGLPPDGKKLKVVYDFKPEDIKKYLSKGKPIIVPAAGRKLGNPNFTATGPWYHSLVLVGYEGETVITNDPGTRKGEGYRYDINILYNAIHDFPGRPEDIEKGRKAMIILE